eukprot:s1381_g25.t1
MGMTTVAEGVKGLQQQEVRVAHMRPGWLVFSLILHGSNGWWFNATTPPPKGPIGDWVHQHVPWFEGTFEWGNNQWCRVNEMIVQMEIPQFDQGLWLVIDTVFGLFGWALFGTAWSNVRIGCRRLFQFGLILGLCLIAHYIWSVCYPIVSLVVGCLMAIVWVLRKILKVAGTCCFWIQRMCGGSPEAAETDFIGPGTGQTPETSQLRNFKTTANGKKTVVVKRGSEIAVFNVGSESQTIRTHGLYIPIESDSVRGSANLVRKLREVDKIHLCRNEACTEEGGEHFAVYGIAKRFNPETFQLAQARQGARDMGQSVWDWLGRSGFQTGTNRVVRKLKEYASESEREEEVLRCQASSVSWRQGLDLKVLANRPCAGEAKPCSQFLTDDLPAGVSQADEEDEIENVEEIDKRGHRARDLLASAQAEEDEGGSRSRRKRATTRSPGSTPRGKTAISRNLSKMGMLSSPGSEATAFLEEFLEMLAEGQADGLREDQVRRRMCALKVLEPDQLLRGLIADGEFEQARGQRGLTKFLTKWRGELSRLEGEARTDTDWSVISQSTPPRTEVATPSSFATTPPTLAVEPAPETVKIGLVEERKGEGLRIATPGVYRADRKAGAGEDVGGSASEPVVQIAKAIQNQTAELASLVRYQSEGSAGQPSGTLKGLKKQSEELVFLMRACGQYAVKVGEGEHGQALANSLLAAQVGASTKLRAAGFRQRMTSRLAVGLAGPFWGTHEKFGLGAADFIAYTDAELDQFASESRGQKNHGEQRPPPPNRFDEWVARVRRQNDVWCLVYGEEWRGVRSNAIDLLSAWHLAHPHRWPLNVVMDVWEELHWRFGEEMKELLRRLKKEIGRETITLNELRFHALLPGPDGQAWLQMPDTFDIERPGAWFQSEVIPRIDRKQERLLWNLTWQGGARRDRPTPTPAGGNTSPVNKAPTVKTLLGPKLNPEETSQAKERAPQDRNGVLLCWGHLSHMGCGVQGCQRSHEPLRGSFEGLDPCVQMQLLKRGGLKRMKLESQESVTTKIKEIRAKMAKEKQEKILDGKKKGRAGASEEVETSKEEQTTDGKAGEQDEKKVRFWEPPEEFVVDFTQGEDLQKLVQGPDRGWERDVHKPVRSHDGRGGETATTEARTLVRVAQELGGHPTLEALNEHLMICMLGLPQGSHEIKP